MRMFDSQCLCARRYALIIAIFASAPAAIAAQPNVVRAQAQSATTTTGLLNPAPIGMAPPPAGFVVVQTNYLEHMVALQKASLDAVAATSQLAITSAKDKEEWLVTLVQTVGISFSVIAACFTFFGISKYAEVKGWLRQINEAKAGASDACTEAAKSAQKVKDIATKVAGDVDSLQVQLATLTGSVDKARDAEDAVAERLGEVEQLVTGMHSQKLAIEQLKASGRKRDDARALLDEIKVLYAIADKHNNERIKSYLAAVLALTCMYAELWEEALAYGEVSMKCNPRNWDDRKYNLACIYAAKFKVEKSEEDKQMALGFLTEYFERNGTPIADIDLQEAIKDVDLASVQGDVEVLAQDYRRAGRCS